MSNRRVLVGEELCYPVDVPDSWRDLVPDGANRSSIAPDGYPEADTDWDQDHGQGVPHVHDRGRPSGGGKT